MKIKSRRDVWQLCLEARPGWGMRLEWKPLYIRQIGILLRDLRQEFQISDDDERKIYYHMQHGCVDDESVFVDIWPLDPACKISDQWLVNTVGRFVDEMYLIPHK